MNKEPAPASPGRDPAQVTQGMLLGLLSTLIFGMTLPMTVIALQSFSPGFISFGRATLAGLLAAAILLLTRQPRPRGR